eukprot:2739164-Pyramimonas_sp.AAC.1
MRLNFACGTVAPQEVQRDKKQLVDFVSKAAPRTRVYTSYCEGSAVRGGAAPSLPADCRAV